MCLRVAAAAVCLSSAIGSLSAQQRVDPRNMYERVIAIVPVIGKGTLEDPKRPMYAPAPSAMSPATRTGIIAYTPWKATTASSRWSSS